MMGLEGIVSKHRERGYAGWPVGALDQGQKSEVAGNGSSQGGDLLWPYNYQLTFLDKGI
jgi:hypothetical protein